MSTPVPVTLVFEGVMVGGYNRPAKIYEMGILPVPGHSFSIAIEERGPLSTAGNEPALIKADHLHFNEIEIGPDDAQWLLQIVGDTPSASLFLPDATPPDRTKFFEIEPAKLDYRWVPNVDKELPNHKPDGATTLPRHEGLLRPVLDVAVGEFYARDLFNALVSFRQGGKGQHKKFGFVPQQVCADFTLDAGKEVVLKRVTSDNSVFKLKAKEDHSYTIRFSNTPPGDQGNRVEAGELPKADINRPTHFQLLYLLFNVPPEKRYELRVLPTSATPAANIEALAIAEELLEVRPKLIGVPTPRCAPIDGGG